MQWFYDLPWLSALGLLLLVCVGGAVACHVAVRRIFKPRDLVQHNEVAGFMISIVAVLYAVLLGFIVVTTWQQFDGTRMNVDAEAAAVSDVWGLMGIYGDRGANVKVQIERFVDLTINEDWPAMSHGGSSVAAGQALRKVGKAIVTLEPTNQRESDVFSRSLERVATVADLRRQRLADNRTSLPAPLWACLAIGALLTVAFGFLFGVERHLPQILMTAAVAGAITLQLFLAVELDYPFRGTVGVSPGAYTDIQREFAAEKH